MAEVNGSIAGRLLVATPLLDDPNFHRTVVLVCFHDENGAFGVVLNRPQEARVADLAPEWSEWVSPPPALFAGGPVEETSVLGLGRIRSAGDPDFFTRVAGRVGLLNLRASAEAAGPMLDAARVFHGYAGWGAGQLEGEIAQDAWFVVDAQAGDPFTEDPAGLWRQVLRRQGGDLAMYGTYPTDPRAN